MATRLKIGIIYSYDENWIGGAYYIQNLIRSLNYLGKADRLQVTVLTKNEQLFQEFKKETRYPNLKFQQYPIPLNAIERFVNKAIFKLFKFRFIKKKVKIDGVFPIYNLPENLKHISNLIYWIPDLQEKFLPDFFSQEELELRYTCQKNMVRSQHTIVFSSYSAQKDFISFYPEAKNKMKVMQFAVTHPDLELKNIDAVKALYSIDGDYFISPNQFWQHKNQIAIIEAAKILKNKGTEVKIVFTGKEYDYRNPNYTADLKEKVKEYGLEKEVIFLGFIDRVDQLLLMKNALAIIQPSLFEGWSTVVEDGKALQQTLIVSNIGVHLEQLEDKGYYFDPNDYNQLASNIIEVIENPIDKIKFNLNYKENIKSFALNFKQLTAENEK